MSAWWVGPLLLALLSLGWFGVQRAWLACMERPADTDALARPGACGTSCACREECARGAVEPPPDPSNKEGMT